MKFGMEETRMGYNVPKNDYNIPYAQLDEFYIRWIMSYAAIVNTDTTIDQACCGQSLFCH